MPASGCAPSGYRCGAELVAAARNSGPDESSNSPRVPSNDQRPVPSPSTNFGNSLPSAVAETSVAWTKPSSVWHTSLSAAQICVRRDRARRCANDNLFGADRRCAAQPSNATFSPGTKRRFCRSSAANSSGPTFRPPLSLASPSAVTCTPTIRVSGSSGASFAACSIISPESPGPPNSSGSGRGGWVSSAGGATGRGRLPSARCSIHFGPRPRLTRASTSAPVPRASAAAAAETTVLSCPSTSSGRVPSGAAAA